MTSGSQLFQGLALLLQSNLRGSWLFETVSTNRREIYETRNHSDRATLPLLLWAAVRRLRIQNSFALSTLADTGRQAIGKRMFPRP